MAVVDTEDLRDLQNQVSRLELDLDRHRASTSALVDRITKLEASAGESRRLALAHACDSVKSGVSTDVVRTAREFLDFLEGDRDAG